MGEGLVAQLEAPVDSAGLVLFRLFFGIILCVSTVMGMRRLVLYYTSSPFYFRWELLPCIQPLGAGGMYAVFFVQAVAAFCLAFGWFYPWSALICFCTWTYVFLLDQSRYNNHYYLISLLLFLFAVVDGTAAQVPLWQVLVFKIQLLIVFMWGGINKLHRDWLLRGYPMRDWFARFDPDSAWGGRWMAPVLRHSAAPVCFAWGGALVDLLVVWGLFSELFFVLSLITYVVFNLFNHWFLRIGTFPFINLAYLSLFIAPQSARWLLAVLEGLCP
ncbi:MAG: HTTM domain-containing protein [Chlamydiia bacterium]|nr:HTTM domain-containing protein [Chlamydiia bacterium]